MYLLFLLASLATHTVSIADSNHPVWDDRLDFQSIEERLLHERIIDSIDIRTYLKNVGKVIKGDESIKLLTLESGFKAIFKPGEYRLAEIAAYKASVFLGLRLVPPTILRTIDGIEGSLQFFVYSPIDLLKGSNRSSYFKKLDPKDISDMKLFYFVFGQWDLHAGNQIITSIEGHYHLALIDNAGMLHKQHIQYGDFAFIQKGENKEAPSLNTPTFPFHEVVTLKPGPLERLKKLFGPYITGRHIERIWQHHKPITYVMWKNAFWMQMYKYNPSVKPLKVAHYYESTLQALRKLDRNALLQIWSDGMKIEPSYYEELIDLILERRDQVLNHAQAKSRT